MDTNAIYSYCISIKDLALLDNTVLYQKIQQFYSQHDRVLDFKATYIDSCKNTLKLTLHDSTTSIMKSRSDLLNNNFIEIQTIIESVHPDIIFQQINRRKLAEKLEQIGNDYQINITIKVSNEPTIVIQGTLDKVEIARVQILIFMDKLLGLYIESVTLPICVHNILGGKRHYQLQSVMEETATNIYLEPPFLIGHVGKSLQHLQRTVYISGDATGTTRAKCLVKKLGEQKLNSMCYKDSTYYSRKIDWILLHNLDNLKKILRDNGSFIHFPPIGAGTNQIHIYAENKINIERTLRLLNYLAYEIYHVIFTFKNSTNQSTILAENHDNFVSFIDNLAQFSGSEILYNGDQNQIEIYGTETSVRLAYQYIKDSSFKKGQLSVSINFEMASEHRLFIKGKKSGKINKIMKTCGAQIKFIPTYGEYNCLMTVESEDIDKAFDGFELLLSELPDELSFIVPEIYHRRIIGVGGKNIQRIMKKYGVYVKFSGADEFTELGGYFENDHNVFARTPRKHHGSLELLCNEIMEQVSFENDRNCISCTVQIPLHLHRIIPNQYSDALRDYGRLHNARIWWPSRNGSIDVSVTGPATQVGLLQTALSNLLPRHVHVLVPFSRQFEKYLQSDNNMDQVKKYIKISLGVAVKEPDRLYKDIPPSTHVKWDVVHSFKNHYIYLLTANNGSEKNLSINGESKIADDCDFRLQSAKNILSDQLANYLILDSKNELRANIMKSKFVSLISEQTWKELSPLKKLDLNHQPIPSFFSENKTNNNINVLPTIPTEQNRIFNPPLASSDISQKLPTPFDMPLLDHSNNSWPMNKNYANNPKIWNTPLSRRQIFNEELIYKPFTRLCETQQQQQQSFEYKPNHSFPNSSSSPLNNTVSRTLNSLAYPPRNGFNIWSNNEILNRQPEEESVTSNYISCSTSNSSTTTTEFSTPEHSISSPLEYKPSYPPQFSSHYPSHSP
ncbi:hypothetical protein BJ944DRAFT_175465 [Cunninghamella echinulata]|nr:hypothetical protein BJ944DRAFT_175465 [Cunninghamella echinulata]